LRATSRLEKELALEDAGVTEFVAPIFDARGAHRTAFLKDAQPVESSFNSMRISQCSAPAPG
jgi:hypothetical protein